jgi:hypothetical protein
MHLQSKPTISIWYSYRCWLILPVGATRVCSLDYVSNIYGVVFYFYMLTTFNTRQHHVFSNYIKDGNSANQQEKSMSPLSLTPPHCMALRPVFRPWPPRSPSSSIPSRLLSSSTPASTSKLENSTLPSTSGISHGTSSSGTSR